MADERNRGDEKTFLERKNSEISVMTTRIRPVLSSADTSTFVSRTA